MIRKVVRRIEKAFYTALNRICCARYKRLYPAFLRRGGILVEEDFQKGGLDPWISPSAYFDPGYPQLISIERGTTISFEACFLAHDYSVDKELFAQGTEHGLVLGRVDVGRNCFIGARAMLLPGTALGDGCIVGAGAVVKGSYPEGSILAGNPARVVGDSKKLLEKHLNKQDISYWRGDRYEEFAPVWPKSLQPELVDRLDCKES
ncbi:MAG: acyltransferase [Coriobacteriia bacterium]|nr:acyltransferase [Coriobacteriia bacterium]